MCFFGILILNFNEIKQSKKWPYCLISFYKLELYLITINGTIFYVDKFIEKSIINVNRSI